MDRMKFPGPGVGGIEWVTSALLEMAKGIPVYAIPPKTRDSGPKQHEGLDIANSGHLWTSTSVHRPGQMMAASPAKSYRPLVVRSPSNWQKRLVDSLPQDKQGRLSPEQAGEIISILAPYAEKCELKPLIQAIKDFYRSFEGCDWNQRHSVIKIALQHLSDPNTPYIKTEHVMALMAVYQKIDRILAQMEEEITTGYGDGGAYYHHCPLWSCQERLSLAARLLSLPGTYLLLKQTNRYLRELCKRETKFGFSRNSEQLESSTVIKSFKDRDATKANFLLWIHAFESDLMKSHALWSQPSSALPAMEKLQTFANRELEYCLTSKSADYHLSFRRVLLAARAGLTVVYREGNTEVSFQMRDDRYLEFNQRRYRQPEDQRPMDILMRQNGDWVLVKEGENTTLKNPILFEPGQVILVRNEMVTIQGFFAELQMPIPTTFSNTSPFL